MDNIFDIRFSFEKKIRDEVIYKFSNKQGGSYNIFSYHWQCFVWAAIIGFLRNEPRDLKSPLADKSFSLNTMKNNGGEKDAQALICLAIARYGSLDIAKDPNKTIEFINRYANGGFYHILKLIENGETSFNDLEQVKQEIFSRSYDDIKNESITEKEKAEFEEVFNTPINNDDLVDEVDMSTNDDEDEQNDDDYEAKPWNEDDIERLKFCFNNEFPLENIALKLNRSLSDVRNQLASLGIIRLPLNVTVKNTESGGKVYNKNGEIVYSDDALLKVFNERIYRFNFKPMCITIKNINLKDGNWEKGGKVLVAYDESALFSILSPNSIEYIEDLVECETREKNRIKVRGVWYDYYGDKIAIRQ